MSQNTKNNLKLLYDSVKFPLLSIVLAFIIGALFIIWTGSSPIVAYSALFSGSLGGLSRIGETLLKTTPLIFTGLAVAFAFRTGLFNIGAEGQYVMGALFTLSAGWIFRGLPGIVLVPLIIVSGALGGAIWAFIPGILKAKIGVHEVIVTIMLNYVALFVSNYFVRTILNPAQLTGDVQKAHTVLLPEHARLTKLNEIIPQFGYSSVHTGIILAIIVAVIAYVVLFKTTLGYEIRSVGHNPYAAEYGGINIAKNTVLAMVISGVFAGLAGATIIAGLTYKVDQSSGSAGYGFTGIAVALVGKNHPLGVLLSALLFGILSNGARKMQIAGVPQEIVGLIQGIIIIFIAGEEIVKIVHKWRIKRSKDKSLVEEKFEGVE
jgi:simple sugar transport system permease protein